MYIAEFTFILLWSSARNTLKTHDFAPRVSLNMELELDGQPLTFIIMKVILELTLPGLEITLKFSFWPCLTLNLTLKLTLILIMTMSHAISFSLFSLFIFRGGEERNISVWEIHWSVASHAPPARDLASNPGMCPDRELNQQPFGSHDGAQSTEPHQPGLMLFL